VKVGSSALRQTFKKLVQDRILVSVILQLGSVLIQSVPDLLFSQVKLLDLETRQKSIFLLKTLGRTR
jgi:hypothetical protein